MRDQPWRWEEKGYENSLSDGHNIEGLSMEGRQHEHHENPKLLQKCCTSLRGEGLYDQGSIREVNPFLCAA